MEYLNFKYENALITLSDFKGECREVHTIIRPASPSESFSAQLICLQKGVKAVAEKIGRRLRPVFMRWFLSDAANQAHCIPDSFKCATSIIQQSPLDGTKVALWVIYKEEADFKEVSPGIWKNGNGELWIGDMPVSATDSFTMTTEYLEQLDKTLNRFGASLADNCLRTWFMVRDIDVNYKGVVKGRNEVFSSKGLTYASHFIASTGINGVSADPFRTVAFNAYADTSVKPSQIRYLHGSTHLNPTAEYGVAFERATAVDYTDRRHIFVSGTASINNRGEIVYPGDVAKQTHRMLENIEVLLKEGGAEWKDVAHLIVYLRDIADYHTVERIFRKRFPEVPTVIVLAPVCRPGWLVETECMAITTK
ncbi:MAG: hypothetical protein K2H60_02380 [Muribaculaceae bacterium]|nr:hypothetical protein [Muribaculaceae bacterium]